MKYKETFCGSKKECLEQLKGVFSNLLNGKLEVEGEAVNIPNDREIEYKIKYEDIPEEEGGVAIKIVWSYVEEEEEEEEEEEFQLV